MHDIRCMATNAFIHSGHFYSAPSSPLLLRGAQMHAKQWSVTTYHVWNDKCFVRQLKVTKDVVARQRLHFIQIFCEDLRRRRRWRTSSATAAAVSTMSLKGALKEIEENERRSWMRKKRFPSYCKSFFCVFFDDPLRIFKDQVEMFWSCEQKESNDGWIRSQDRNRHSTLLLLLLLLLHRSQQERRWWQNKGRGAQQQIDPMTLFRDYEDTVKYGNEIRRKENTAVCGTRWRLGWVDSFQPEGHGFDSRSSHPVGTLGKSFTYSCLCASAWNSDTVSVL